MKDIGLGVLDPYTVIIVIIVLAVANLGMGLPIPFDTSSAISTMFGVVLITGYIYLGQTLYRLPVFLYAARRIQREEVLLKKPGGILPFIKTLLDVRDQKYKSTSESNALRNIKENILLMGFLRFLDRLALILIAVLLVHPAIQAYLFSLGLTGIGLMLLVFLFKGNFSALASDNLQPKSKEPLVSVETKDKSQVVAKEEQKPPSVKNIGTCVVCGKPAKANKIPLCSSECRQLYFKAWEHDKEIGFGAERDLIESQRHTEYKSWEQLEVTVNKLEDLTSRIPVSMAIWALFAMLRDIYVLQGNDNQYIDHIQSIKRKLKPILEKTSAGRDILLALLSEDCAPLVYEAIIFLRLIPYDYETIYLEKVIALLDHELQSIRATAIEILGREGYIEVLYERLGKNKPPELDTLSIEAMGQSRKDPIPLLKKAQMHHLHWVRKDATAELRKLGIDAKESEVVIQEFLCPNENCQAPVKITYPRNHLVSQKGLYKLKFFQKSKLDNRCSRCGTRIGVQMQRNINAILADDYEQARQQSSTYTSMTRSVPVGRRKKK